MNNKRLIFLVVVCAATFGFLISGVYAYSVSPGGYSSSSSLSFDSSKGISKTSVTTISSPSQGQPAQGVQTGASVSQIPSTWILDVNTATFFDPVTNSAWLFDRMLQHFYSPNSGLFLIILSQPDLYGNIAYNQYYYNPFTGDFYDILSGQILLTNPLSTGSPVSPISSPTPPPSQGSSSIIASTVSQSSTSTVPSPGGLDETAQSTFLPYECPVLSCPDCDEGYCLDCDYDGKCDVLGELL
ncbi:MAG: hypothetical protein GXY48_05735 [Methanomicrobiales archaeon]|nr:hypothetical protein [Methanomicrobiales archaeon]